MTYVASKIEDNGYQRWSEDRIGLILKYKEPQICWVYLQKGNVSYNICNELIKRGCLFFGLILTKG